MIPIPVLLSLVACKTLDDFKLAFEGLTDAMVAQGVVLGMEEPDAPELQPLVEAEVIDPGVTVQVFLADASNADDMGNAPIDGADVVVDSVALDTAAVSMGDGLYSVEPGTSNLRYTEGEQWTLWIDAGREEPSWIELILPPPADVDVAPTHVAGQPMDLDFTGQPFQSAIIVVLDTAGAITWSNEPETIDDVYGASSNDEALGVITIPSEAFPGSGVFGVGVAGMQHNTDEQLAELNTLLSRGMAGVMQVHPVVIP